MKLNEILNKKVDYEVVKATSTLFQTRAEINGRTINFGAVAGYGDMDDTWEIQFAEKVEGGKPTYKKTGSGKELEVFSFIKDSITEFVSRYHPEKMDFTADKEGHDDNRADTYERLLKRFKIPGYEFERENHDGASVFSITKKNN